MQALQFTLTFLALTIAVSLFGQAGTFDCAQSELHQHRLSTDPAYRDAHALAEKELRKQALEPARASVLYTLPVVFHIIHDGGAENIPDAQVEQALQHLNDAFANTAYYDPSTGVDVEIQFCLARRDPEGDATIGIERVQSSLTSFNYSVDDQTLKDLSRYDPLQYINIWVVQEICSNNGCGVAGYAYLPAAHGLDYDGIVVEAGLTGNDPANSAVLVHEMGHYLGLYHTFQDGCTNNDCLADGDRVCDTPPDNTTARPPCEVEQNSCSSDADDPSANNPFRPVANGGLGDQPDAHENYMDYSRLACYNQFTAGQATRMQNAVSSLRSSLLSSPACTDPCPSPASAAFSLSSNPVSLGETLTAANLSTNATNYEWYVDGTLVSTAANLSYDFPALGTYEVELLAYSDLDNCLPASSVQTVTVVCPVEASITPLNTAVLPGTTVSFQNNSMNATTYQWRVNGMLMGTDPDFDFTPDASGVYDICLQASNGLCSDQTCALVQTTFAEAADSCEPTFYLSLGQLSESNDISTIIRSNDGNLYVGGGIGAEAVIAKFTPEGEQLWARTFDFTDRDDQILSLRQDQEGMLFGTSYGTVEGAGPNGRGALIFRYDPEADDLLWTNYTDQRGRLHRIKINPVNGNYIAHGVHITVPMVNDDAVLMEVAPNTGAILWRKVYNRGSSDYFGDVLFRGDRMYTTGRSTFNTLAQDMRISLYSFDFDGNVQWSRFYLHPQGATARQYGESIKAVADGLVTTYYGPVGTTSLTQSVSGLIKTDFDGIPQWSKEYQLDGFEYWRLYDMLQTADGFLLYGYGGSGSERELILIRTDLGGNVIWANAYSGSGLQEAARFGGPRVAEVGGYYYLIGQETVSEQGLLLKVRADNGQFNNPNVCLFQQPLEVNTVTDNNPFHELFTLQEVDPNISAGQPLANSAVPVDWPSNALCAVPQCGENTIDCDTTYVKQYGDPAQDEGAIAIAQSPDGFLYIGGYSGGAVALSKSDKAGNLQWRRTIDLSSTNDQVRALRFGSDGMLYGTALGMDPFDADTRIGFVFKYDPMTDELLWSTRLFDRCLPKYLAFKPTNGNPVIGGSVKQGDLTYALLAEVDAASGDLLWDRKLERGRSAGYNALAFANNTLYAVGRYEFEAGLDKMRVTTAAFDFDGNDLWQQQYLYPPSAVVRQYAHDMAAAPDGLVVSFNGSEGNTDFLNTGRCGLYKTDYEGNLLWAKAYELPAYDAVLAGNSLTRVSDGYLLNGLGVNGSNDIVLIKTDFDGNALWAKAYGRPVSSEVSLPTGAGVRLLADGDDLYFVAVYESGGEALLFRTDWEGDVLNGDCDFVNSVEVDTELLLNPYQGEATHTEVNLPFNPVTDVPAVVEGDTSSFFICAPRDCTPPCLLDFTVEVDTAFCTDGQLQTQLLVCNLDTATFSGTLPLILYDGNPTEVNATAIDTIAVSVDEIADGSCNSLSLLLPLPNGTLYFSVNDSAAVSPPFDPSLALARLPEECDYLNNLDSLSFTPPSPTVDLGEDFEVCENSAIPLDAGPGFDHYLWSDGSTEQTLTAFEPGTYWVEVENACGLTASDTITVTMTDPVVIDVDPAVAFICPEDTADIALSVADGYEVQWLPTEGLSCSDCAEVEATPDESTLYTVTATTPEGCVSADSVLVNVIPCEQVIDTSTCANDSISLLGKNFFPGVPDTVSLGNDSILLVNVEPEDTVLVFRDTLVCFGDSVVFDGVSLSGGEEEAFVYTLPNGCDSTIVLAVTERPRITDTTAVSICQGDTAVIFGTARTTAGLYEAQFTAASGCDSTHYIQLTVLDTPSVDIPVSLLSCETGSGSLLAAGAGGSPPYAYAWSNGAAGMENEGLPPGTYTVTVTDSQGCSAEGTGLVLDSLPVLELQVATDSASCFDTADGTLIAEAASGGTPPYQYSLDGAVYQSSPVFTGLPAGPYTLYMQDAEACEDSLSATIGAPPPLSLSLPPDTTLQLGDSIAIVPAYGGQPDFFDWSPATFLNCADCPSPTATPSETVRYFLTIGNGANCTLTEAITIFVEKPRRIYIPNAVSPNGDGVNDVFRLYPGRGVERILSTRIFDRWGELVFEAENYVPDNVQPTWDGAFRGEMMQSAVFTYVVEVQFVDGVVLPFTGALHLVR